jgi:uncharacterized protein (UPF0216 family)
MIQPQEPTAAELAFDEFRKEFPLINVYVRGDQMTYRFNHNEKEILEGWKVLAETVVERLKLPIVVSTERNMVATIPMLLILTYKTENENKPSQIDN